MNERARGAFFALIASALRGEALDDAARADIEDEALRAVLRLAKRQDLVALVAHALQLNGLAPEAGELAELVQREGLSSFVRYERANYELHAVSRALGERKIAHVPLKGAVIRDFYPEPWLRTSCDIDILVREEELADAVECIVTKLGYREGERGSHDVALTSPSGVMLELHFDLNEPDYRRFDCLSRAWDYMTPREGGSAMKMRDDLFYFYHISHMAKHIVNGGCGVRPFVDLWLMIHRDSFDKTGGEAILLSEGLGEFGRAAEHLSEVWFSRAKPDERALSLERYILDGGLYGSADQRIKVQQVKRGGKLKYALSRIFLPYEQMKGRYPVLVRHKWLLPFMHIRRWFGVIFGGGFGRSVDELRTNAASSDGEMDQMREFLEDIGL